MKVSFIALTVLTAISINSSYTQWISTGGPGDIVTSFVSRGTVSIAGTMHNGIYRYTEADKQWVNVANGSYVNSIAVYGKHLFAVNRYLPILGSSDFGQTWYTVTEPYDNDLKMPHYNCILGNGNKIFVGKSIAGSSFSVLMASSNMGVSWFNSDAGIQGEVFCLAAKGDTLLAGTSNTLPGYGLYLSSNNGLSWTSIGLMYVSSVSISGDYLYSNSANNGLYLSTNYGTNWIQLTNGIPSNAAITSITSNEDYVLAAIYGYGIYFSQDNGNNWTLSNNGLNTLNIRTIVLKGPYVYAGADDGQVYTKEILAVTSPNTINKSIPDKYSLSQNYPNPFNPSTKISYDLPKEGIVKLVVFDAIGREVKTVVNEKQSAGSYKVEFDGSSVPSGVYFYKLQTSEFTQTKKMILIK